MPAGAQAASLTGGWLGLDDGVGRRVVYGAEFLSL